MIETVNAGLEELHVQVPDAGSSAPAYEEIAAVYEALGKQLDDLAPADATLAKALASYRDVAERAATHSRAYSVELTAVAKSRPDRANKEARLNRIRTLAKSDLAREATAVRKLNSLCHPQ